MEQGARITVIVGVLIALALSIITPAFTATGDAEGDTAPRITDAYVEPVKVRPGDTMLVSAAVGGG